MSANPKTTALQIVFQMKRRQSHEMSMYYSYVKIWDGYFMHSSVTGRSQQSTSRKIRSVRRRMKVCEKSFGIL